MDTFARVPEPACTAAERRYEHALPDNLIPGWAMSVHMSACLKLPTGSILSIGKRFAGG